MIIAALIKGWTIKKLTRRRVGHEFFLDRFSHAKNFFGEICCTKYKFQANFNGLESLWDAYDFVSFCGYVRDRAEGGARGALAPPLLCKKKIK